MARIERRCQACRAELYADEGPSFCQDCTPIVARIMDLLPGHVRGDDTWTRRLPPEERAAREAALAVQAERIARELPTKGA